MPAVSVISPYSAKRWRPAPPAALWQTPADTVTIGPTFDKCARPTLLAAGALAICALVPTLGAASTPTTNPLAAQRDSMASLSAPRDVDNNYAQRGRLRYADMQKTVAAEADKFSARGANVKLENTDAYQRVNRGTTRQTLYLKDGHGHRAGEFEVVHRWDKNTQARYSVQGLSIYSETHNTVHGFAGDIKRTVKESVEVPEVSILSYPQTQFHYSRTETYESDYGKISKTEEIDVKQDGSTHNRVKMDGHDHHFDEAPAKATPLTRSPE